MPCKNLISPISPTSPHNLPRLRHTSQNRTTMKKLCTFPSGTTYCKMHQVDRNLCRFCSCNMKMCSCKILFRKLLLEIFKTCVGSNIGIGIAVQVTKGSVSSGMRGTNTPTNTVLCDVQYIFSMPSTHFCPYIWRILTPLHRFNSQLFYQNYRDLVIKTPHRLHPCCTSMFPNGNIEQEK